MSRTSTVKADANPKPVTHNQLANAIRALSMDAVQKADSGHPGMPMGMADVATVLFTKFLKFDPSYPTWPDRDRFILSAGHGSMLLYSLAWLTGYEKMTLDELKSFRQLHHITPGHPEVMPEVGIETTTGPLGQGLGNAVGMALAERIMAERFGAELVNHYTYVIASDGDLMEGISHEACSLAGHLGLGKLIVLYDDNGITIDGSTDLSFTEDTLGRFKAYGWDTIAVDGHDAEAVAAALHEAHGNKNRPTLIACRTKIGYGAPTKEGKSSSHGSPLGQEEIAGARKTLGWPHEPFEVPEDILAAWRAVGAAGVEARKSWQLRLDGVDSEKREDFDRAIKGNAAKQIDVVLSSFISKTIKDAPKIATRQASGNTLDVLLPVVPEMIGGSADLTGSNNTRSKNADQVVSKTNFNGRYIHYGVREHGMAAMMNGMALHGGIIPYSGTFLTFSDYCRPSIRLSALMKQRVIYVMTHDSIGLGEDGPTHQPVEHLAALRAIPNLLVMRPADAVETAECWQIALESRETPSVLALTRQALPTLRKEDKGENLSRRGAYVVQEAENAKVTIFATGSEVEIAVEARGLLEKEGIAARVVSVPSMELFAQQDDKYRAAILGGTTIKVAIEAAVRQGWDRFIGNDGIFIGMKGFGDSGPYKELYKHFGITAEAVVQAVKQGAKK